MNQNLQLRHQGLNRAAVGCAYTDTVLVVIDRRAGRQTDGGGRTFDHLDGHFSCRMGVEQTRDVCLDNTAECT